MGSSKSSDSVIDESLLSEASLLLNKNRMDDYGDPRVNLRRIARLWSALLDVEISAEQVALMMVLVKLSRQQHRALRDNVADSISYLLLADTLSSD